MNLTTAEVSEELTQIYTDRTVWLSIGVAIAVAFAARTFIAGVAFLVPFSLWYLGTEKHRTDNGREADQ